MTFNVDITKSLHLQTDKSLPWIDQIANTLKYDFNVHISIDIQLSLVGKNVINHLMLHRTKSQNRRRPLMKQYIPKHIHKDSRS